MSKNSRIGEINVNKYGSVMKIVEYNTNKDIVVEFQDEYKHRVHTGYNAFKNGSVQNITDRTRGGVGYMGVGPYSSITHHTFYSIWSGIIKRCYDEKALERNPSYRGCELAEEWCCFQNFASWCEENYYEIEGEVMNLDKDILYKGNMIYSPETCVFVPQRINVVFTQRNRSKYDLPVGCHKHGNSIQVACEGVHLGSFSNVEEAFKVYKEYKENSIKKLADEYKNQIPDILYEAMYNYTIDIDD